MCDITVVCCRTNEQMYNNFTDTLKSQSIHCKIIGIDNTNNKNFTSCASAYNSVIDDVKTQYVIYSHQDILLNQPDILEKFLSYLKRIERDDILGAAGVNFDLSPGISDITHRNNRTGKFVHGTSSFIRNGMTECGTVDECFFGGYTQHFRDYPFDELLCNNWHLYAAEQCLRTKSLSLGKVWVCSIPLVHLSSGTVSPSFQYGFYRLCRKYSASFPFIRTTCAYSRTDFLHLFPRFIYLWCGAVLRKSGLRK